MPHLILILALFYPQFSFAKIIHPHCLDPLKENIEVLRKTSATCGDMIPKIKAGIPEECQHYVFSELEPELQATINKNSNFGLNEKLSVVYGKTITALKKVAGRSGCISPRGDTESKAEFDIEVNAIIAGHTEFATLTLYHGTPTEMRVKDNKVTFNSRWIIPSNAEKGHYEIEIKVVLKDRVFSTTAYEFGMKSQYTNESKINPAHSFKIVYTIRKKN